MSQEIGHHDIAKVHLPLILDIHYFGQGLGILQKRSLWSYCRGKVPMEHDISFIEND